MNKKSIKNTDIFKSNVFYQSNDAKDFNSKINRLTLNGFKVIKVVLTDDGVYKLVAKIKKRSITNCLLTEKTLPKKDAVTPHATTYPELCYFYKNGYCSCVDHKFCLYQKTKENVNLIKNMVDCYNDNDRDYHDKCSIYYEDTVLGRIFSLEYQHLNNPDIHIKAVKKHREHGR